MLTRALVSQRCPCPRPLARVSCGRRPLRRVTCWARSQADGSLVDGDTLRNLSPEARKIFQEAQENIIEINKGRIRALEELKAAKKRIAELEGQLEEALTDVNQAAAQVAELKSVTASFTTLDQPPVQVQQVAPPPPPPAPAAAAPPPPPPPPPAPVVEAPAPPPPAPAPPPEPTVVIVYETSWNTAFLHYNADNKGWTTTPGSRMEEGSEQYAGKKVLRVPCNRLEFVATNGKNDWDHPDQYESGGTKNYVITTPGVYQLKGGRVNKLA